MTRMDSIHVEEHLSTEQVAERLSVSPQTVARWIKSGRLAPVRKLGRLMRIPSSAVNRFLAQRTVGGDS
jgi:excisionase family DNA binding protein